MPTITPTIADITINATTWTHADWEGNPTGTLSEIGNAIGTQLTALGATTGTLAKTISGDTTLTGAEATNLCFVFGGTLSAAAAITFPAGLRHAVIVNNTTGGYGLTVGLATGATVSIPVSGSAVVYCDGTDFKLADGIARSSDGTDITGTLDVTGALTCAALTATGDVALNGTTSVTGSLGVTGTLTCAALTATGNVALNGATSVTGTLAVSGAATLASTLAATGNINGEADIFATGDVEGSSITARKAAAAAYVVVDSPDGQLGLIDYRSNDVTRWYVGKSVANYYEITRFDSTGTNLGIVFQIPDDTGYVRLPNLPTAAAGLLAGTLWNNAGVINVA